MPPTSHTDNNAPSPFRFSNSTFTPSRSVSDRRDDALPPTSAQPQQSNEHAEDPQFAKAPKFSTHPKRQDDQRLTPRRSYDSVVLQDERFANHNQECRPNSVIDDVGAQRTTTAGRFGSKTRRQSARRNVSTSLGDGFDVVPTPLKRQAPSRRVNPSGEGSTQRFENEQMPDQEKTIPQAEDLRQAEDVADRYTQVANEDLDMLDYAPDAGQDEDMLDQAPEAGNDEDYSMPQQADPSTPSAAVLQRHTTFAESFQAQPRSPSPKRPRLMPPPLPPSRQTDPSTQTTPNRTTPHFAPTPRFDVPSSSPFTPQTPTATRHRPFLPFLRQSIFASPQTQESENIYLLPNAFSPHRRKDRFLPGGLASRVRGWLVDASASTGTSTTITLLHNPNLSSIAEESVTTPPTTLTFHPETGLVVRIEHVISTSSSTASSPSSSTDYNNLQTSMHILLASVPNPSTPFPNAIQTTTSAAKDRRTIHVLLSGSTESNSSVVSGIGAPQTKPDGSTDAGDAARKLREGVYLRLKTPVWKMPLGSDAGLLSAVGEGSGGSEAVVEWVVCARWSVL